ncbi:anthranilate phosphoribosyltransferase [Akkermansiaceae bacterium]|nr:anthranilate phosphoribosyltransferase [Akkermansiaceae bacterium]MDB4626723.1 anthranilate phosphoribosyltransferase [Akkermansiaceae bacterium]MDB4667481.1 anthranilate phosphoribosyltransferase [Akkermansiaceae bacterium]
MDALIHHLEQGQDLEPREITVAADFLLEDGAELEKKGRLLKALAEKGETAAEIAEFVSVFLEKAVKPDFLGQKFDGPTIDVCGTGGDKLDLFNISTTSMFVVAAAGGIVIKHGNRGVTSKSGSSDVLSELGVRLDLPSERIGECLEKAGVGFLFAPMYHPAFKAVAPVRAALAEEGVRTIFNLIGPLLNPANPECQLIGVMDQKLCPVFADILQRLGRDSAWVVNGSTQDGRSVDEVSLMGPTRICKAGRYQGFVDEEIQPADFGLELTDVASLKGGDASENAETLIAILSGKETGPKRDIVLLNASAAIACAGLADDMGRGLKIAAEMIDTGAAIQRLRRLQELVR